MEEKYLYEKIEVLDEMGMLKPLPDFINNGLAAYIDLREYQKKAFQYFITYYETEELSKNKQIHTLFHMATGSGKTVIMAGLILYLYSKGYDKFLFFVNQSNVVEKTKENFINPLSSKYLFNRELKYLDRNLKINIVDNFTEGFDNTIEICFTTTQKLHMDLLMPKENSITYKDFENNKIVFISDESHHINSLTKKETKDEEFNRKSWEYSVTNALAQNKDSIMLEFTATADLKDPNVVQKYKDKIIFDYQLKKFRESGYTKDFQNFATESELWDRTLMALVLSEYRKYLFNENKINIKPVVMLKSQKIEESKSFYNLFFKHIDELTSYELMNLYNSNIDILTKALDYFKSKDESFELLEHSIKVSFTKETSIIMNETTDNNKEKQLLVNSLEDKDNPIRLIFTVDMLNEGWDVLNLFDIVRLYDTRQGSGKAGKVGSYTIKEAQLIGRGARYCPFKINAEQEKYKRKYDDDLTNNLRILETMFFHSRNDSKYIAELKQALIETGLQDKDPIRLDYKLKNSFKESDFYKKAFVFSNKRVLKDRKNVVDIEGSMKTKAYHYDVKTNKGNVVSLMDDAITNVSNSNNIKVYKFKEIDYNILLGASEFFNELKFNVIKSKYPNVESLKEFEPMKLKDVLKDKSIYLSQVEGNGGKGYSQNNCINEAYRLDLSNEDWYAFNDNYGTSEEKLFIKYFKTSIEPKLHDKDLEYYVVRNERVPELAIYSFDHGERFEPDFLLFVSKRKSDKLVTHQLYAEPKGSNRLEEDKWKEEFMSQMFDTATINTVFDECNNYKIIGLPFYNEENKKMEFEQAIDKWLETI